MVTRNELMTINVFPQWIGPYLFISQFHPPIEGVCLGDGPVQPTGRSVTDQLEEQDHAVAAFLGHSQIHALPRLGGDLD